jgi:hypothetical protein
MSESGVNFILEIITHLKCIADSWNLEAANIFCPSLAISVSL